MCSCAGCFLAVAMLAHVHSVDDVTIRSIYISRGHGPRVRVVFNSVRFILILAS